MSIETITERKPAGTYCKGYEVPAIVIYKNGTVSNRSCFGCVMTVSALNPKETKGGHRLGRGLFIDGPRVDNPNIAMVLALRLNRTTGEVIGITDVTKYVKMGIGPGM